MKKFNKMVSDLAEKKYKTIMGKQEDFLAAFIAETGLKPSECEMVVRQTIDGEVISFRRLSIPVLNKSQFVGKAIEYEKEYPDRITKKELVEFYFDLSSDELKLIRSARKGSGNSPVINSWSLNRQFKDRLFSFLGRSVNSGQLVRAWRSVRSIAKELS